jgi:hypothetical protein
MNPELGNRPADNDAWEPYPQAYRDPNSPGYRDPEKPQRQRRRLRVEEVDEGSGVTAPRIALAIAVVGSVIFLALAVLARNIPLLASASAVFGIVFVVLAVAGGRGTWQAASDGRNRRALGLAVGGGLAAIIGLASLALAIDLALIWGR